MGIVIDGEHIAPNKSTNASFDALLEGFKKSGEVEAAEKAESAARADASVPEASSFQTGASHYEQFLPGPLDEGSAEPSDDANMKPWQSRLKS